MNPSHSKETQAGLHAVGEADICRQHSLGTLLLHNTAQLESKTQARPANAPHQAWQPCPALSHTSRQDGNAGTGVCTACPTMAMLLLLNQGRNADQRQTELQRLLDALQTRLSRLDLQLQVLLNSGTDSQSTEVVQQVSGMLHQQGAQCLLLEADLDKQVSALTESLHMIGWYLTEQRAAAAGQSYM